jgi:uncharacterized protein YbbC (DUF1343 family)/CubicO group peptidase (beta-lactamase class C family)
MRMESSFGVRRLVTALVFLTCPRRQVRPTPSVAFSFNRDPAGSAMHAALRLAPRWVAVKRGWLECRVLALVFMQLMGGAAAAADGPPKLPHAAPQHVGMNAARLAAIDQLVGDEIEDGEMAGAVVLVARRGRTVYLQAFGHRQVEPAQAPMTTDTVFDLASLTKPIATATSVMKLAALGQVKFDDPVAKYVPEFAQNGKQDVTIRHLLTHQSGLTPDNALRDYEDGTEKAWQRIWALPLTAEPGSRFIYSDVGFIVLAEIVHGVSGSNVHEFSRQHVFGPLGLAETGYLPDESFRRRAAATEQRDGRWMCGEVHDPRAYLLGGIAGHAGLFSTAEDLAVYAQMLIQDGQYGGVQILPAEVVAQMTTPQRVGEGAGLRGLGWDMRTGYSSNRGDLFSPRAFGHGGFTGTGIWIDPQLQLIVIFLSNRLHPDGKGTVNPLIGRIGTIAAAAIEPDSPSPPAMGTSPEEKTLTGIDVLVRNGFRELQGRRVGLITNQTGVDGVGVSTVELLRRAEGVDLKALFSPEHGLEGKLDVAKIRDTQDAGTGLPVYSLYGENRSPTADSLQGLDTLVFDIQDIGARFYTYISTMGNAMRTAAEHQLRFVVLDRPNPINGVDVAGPVLDDGSQSFVGFHTLPVRHGMTVGELAAMFNEELQLGVDLQIVPVEHWRREDYFDRTGLLWVNPSPNMRSLAEAVLYPGIGLLETTNVSVGRGTDTPFEVLGAPWLDGIQLARALNQCGLPGVRFVPVRFTPASSQHAGQLCGGVNIVVVDRAGFRPVRTGLEIARQLYQLFPQDWQTKRFNALLSDRSTLDAVLAGKTVDEMETAWSAELQEFLQRRSRFLRY